MKKQPDKVIEQELSLLGEPLTKKDTIRLFSAPKINPERMGYLRWSGKLAAICTPEKCTAFIPSPETFSLRIKSPHNTEKNLKKYGKLLSVAFRARVRLNNPDHEYLGLFLHPRFLIFKKNTPSKILCKPNDAPFKAPVALDPELARAMIFLAQPEKNDLLLDPFCGTGTIPITAKEFNIPSIGADISGAMISGAEKNTIWTNVKTQLIHSDIAELSRHLKHPPSIIVTDPPYGLSSKTHGNSIDNLFSLIRKIKPKRTVFAWKEPTITVNRKPLTAIASLYVHKGLTRYIFRIEGSTW